MAPRIFINLPVANLEVSKAFYTALGFSPDEAYSNQDGITMVVSDHIAVMLASHSFFQSLIQTEVANSKTTTEVIHCLTLESRKAVQAFCRKATQAGGTTPRPPKDLGFMYSEAFADPDGHLWVAFHAQEQAS